MSGTTVETSSVVQRANLSQENDVVEIEVQNRDGPGENKQG